MENKKFKKYGKFNLRAAFLSGSDLFNYWKCDKLKFPRRIKENHKFTYTHKRMGGAKLFAKAIELMMPEIISGKGWSLGRVMTREYNGKVKVALRELDNVAIEKLMAKDLPMMRKYDFYQSGGKYSRPRLDWHTVDKYPFYMGVSMPQYLEDMNSEINNNPFFEYEVGNAVFGKELFTKVYDYYDGLVPYATIESACRYGRTAILETAMRRNMGLIIGRKAVFNSESGFTFYPMDKNLNTMTYQLIAASARNKAIYLDDPVEWVWCPRNQFKTERGIVKAYVYPYRRIGMALHTYKELVVPATKEMTKQIHRTYRRYYGKITSRYRYSEIVNVPKELII